MLNKKFEKKKILEHDSSLKQYTNYLNGGMAFVNILKDLNEFLNGSEVYMIDMKKVEKAIIK